MKLYALKSDAQQIPNDRFDIQTHVDASGTSKNTSRTPYGCFLDQPGHFDTNIFGISPREARVIDPIQRLLLMTTYEALEAAGYANADGRRVATFFGQATDDWRETNASQDIDLYYVPGGMRAFGPGRLNYHFKWEGPSYSVDTACSSSTAAVEMACKALLAGDCDMAVVGGGNLLSGPQMFAGLSRGGFLSPTGSCKTLDQAADGYCRAEGVGVVVLKRLQDAVAERDLIQGVVASVATNHSAHATSITHPHAPTQKRLYQTVIQKALLQPADIGYVEMHGTGTQAGDATEVQSICSLFGNSHEAGSPLRIGAAKANVGHGEAVSLCYLLLLCASSNRVLLTGRRHYLNYKVATHAEEGRCPSSSWYQVGTQPQPSAPD
jgi:acyl transferase domain-containing protein